MSTGRIIAIFAGSVALAAVCVGAFLYEPELSRQELQATLGGPDSKFMTLSSGASLHYRDQGNKDGPALVMIHGGFASLHSWERWIAPLESDYRLISMDLLGHGLTGASPKKLYARSQQRDAVAQLLAKLQLERYAVAGNSFGGSVAIELAATYPNQVSALILINSEGLPNRDGGYDASMFSQDSAIHPKDPSFRQLSWHERLAPRFVGSSVVRTALESMMHDDDLVTDALVEQFASALRHEGNGEAQVLMFRQNLYEIAQNGPQDLLEKLTTLKMPALILQGEHDELVPMAVAKRFDQHLANSTLKVVKGAGHIPMLEAPLQSAEILRDFLRELEG